MLPIIANYPPPTVKGKYIKIKFVTQLPTKTPSFAFFCSNPQYIKESYKRFIENKQPYLTLHGHVHESSRLTGVWKEKIGSTYCFQAANDSKELSIIKFDLDNPGRAVRVLI